MKQPKCTKLPLPGEIYSVVWEGNPEYKRLVKVISYKDRDEGMMYMFPPKYYTWEFKSQSLEGNGKGTVNWVVRVENPGDECLVWARLKEPTEEDLKRRTVFDE